MVVKRFFLSPEYIPEILPHRENQIKYLAKKIENFIKTGFESDVFVFGPSGIGKTATVKHVAKLAESKYNIKCIYINCWKNNTESSIMYELNRSIGILSHRRGLSSEELFQRFTEGLSKLNKKLCIILDEIDKFSDINSLLYKLIRYENVHLKPLLIMVSNKKEILGLMDERVASSLFVDEIEFKKYTINELKDIFEERLKLAFDNYEKGCSLLLANYSFMNNSDVRYGLKLLLKASSILENSKDKKLKVEHIKIAMKELKDANPKKEEIIDQLKKELKDIISLLKDENGLTTTSKLFEKYKDIYPISIRTFRNYLKKLEKLGIIKIEERRGGERGSKFFVILKV